MHIDCEIELGWLSGIDLMDSLLRVEKDDGCCYSRFELRKQKQTSAGQLREKLEAVKFNFEFNHFFSGNR
jgi:hypothetical protein